MSEHDPIREWHAQQERAEYVLKVALRLRGGEILHREAAAALRVAGVPEKTVAKALGDEPQDPVPPPPSEREPMPGERVRWVENDAVCEVLRVEDHDQYGRVVWGLWDGEDGTESYVPAREVEILAS